MSHIHVCQGKPADTNKLDQGVIITTLLKHYQHALEENESRDVGFRKNRYMLACMVHGYGPETCASKFVMLTQILPETFSVRL